MEQTPFDSEGTHDSRGSGPLRPDALRSAAYDDGKELIDDAHAERGFGESSAVTKRARRGPCAAWWRRAVTWWVLVYGVILALIAFWPHPVDAAAADFLAWIVNVAPHLTYQRIEFGANILLFVPFGMGAGAFLRRQRYLVMPLALVVSLTFESVQALLLAERTPSLYDILANVAGASLGLIVLVAGEGIRRRPHRE